MSCTTLSSHLSTSLMYATYSLAIRCVAPTPAQNPSTNANTMKNTMAALLMSSGEENFVLEFLRHLILRQHTNGHRQRNHSVNPAVIFALDQFSVAGRVHHDRGICTAHPQHRMIAMRQFVIEQ